MKQETFNAAAFVNSDALPAEDMETRLWRLASVFGEMEERPPGGAIEYRSFARTCRASIENPDYNPMLVDFLKDSLSLRRRNSAQYIGQLIRLGFQNTLRHLDVISPGHERREPFPYGCQTTEQWDENSRFLLSNPLTYEAMLEMIMYNENQANIAKRMAGLKLAAFANAHLLGDSFDLADLGCSAGLGQVHLGANLPLVVRVNGPQHVRKLVHYFLKRPIHIGANVGIEKMPVTNWMWIETCSTYPDEYEQRNFFEQAAHVFKDKVDFKIVNGDVSEVDEERSGLADARAQTAAGKFGVASAINCFWEIEDQEDHGKPVREVAPGSYTEQAFRNLESLADLAVFQESAIPTDGPYPAIANNIYKTPYNLFSKAVAEGQRGYELLGTWKNFRCHTFTPTQALVNKLRQQLESGRLAA